MSQRKDRKQSARMVREQLARERRRRRTMWTAIGAVLALFFAGVIGYVVYQSQKPTTFVAPANATNDGGTSAGLVAGGDGPAKVEVYLDYICPICKQFETTVTPTINQLIAEKKITLVWHPLGFLDSQSTTQYSTRAASAAGCASDGGKLKEYGEKLFANQPAEGSAGLTNDQLVSLGNQVGLTSPDFAQCVRGEKYRDWVGHVTDDAVRRGVTGTPTVYVNGKVLEQPTAENLKAAVG